MDNSGELSTAQKGWERVWHRRVPQDREWTPDPARTMISLHRRKACLFTRGQAQAQAAGVNRCLDLGLLGPSSSFQQWTDGPLQEWWLSWPCAVLGADAPRSLPLCWPLALCWVQQGWIGQRAWARLWMRGYGSEQYWGTRSAWGDVAVGSPSGSDGKASAYNVGDLGSIPGLGRSPGEGNGNPLQYPCLKNSMDWGAW